MSRRSFGLLLAELRRQRGYSQQRLAELLCSASGSATVSRHEISRWERGDRLPGRHWLSWLALVLDTPLARLTGAVRASRPLEQARPDPVDDLVRLATRWARADHRSAPPDALQPADPFVARLRRMDDLVGGVDLVGVLERHRRAVPAPRDGTLDERCRGLRRAAELAQLAGWSAADAGDLMGALRAYTDGLALAMQAGDRHFGAHLLGCASHALVRQRPRAARQLAAIASAATRRAGTPGLRALLAQRLALAAAYDGAASAGQDALLVARRLSDRLVPEAEPSWLYWLDHAQLNAMTGRCLVILDRPLRALPLLLQGEPTEHDRSRPRDLAFHRFWLARALWGLGELEQACVVGGDALIETIRSGSARAASGSRELAVRLSNRPDVPAARQLSDLIVELSGYLPRPLSQTID